MKEKVNVLFACGYGLGSSVFAESLVKKALIELDINAEVMHTALGEMSGYYDWADVIVISKKLAQGIDFDSLDLDVIVIVNIMDGMGIAKQIEVIVDEKFPEVRGIK